MWKILLGDVGVDKDEGKFIPVTHNEGTERVGVIGPLTLNPDARWCGWSTLHLGVFSPGKNSVLTGGIRMGPRTGLEGFWQR